MKSYLKQIRFKNLPWKELLAVIILLFAFVFFRSERHEMAQIIPQLKLSDGFWLLIGVLLTGVYIALQAYMYVMSFRAVNLNLNFWTAIDLFLKRNLLSVFLPAGGVSSLGYLPRSLKKQKYHNTAQIHQASAIYGFVGFLTVLIVGIPLIIYSLFINKSIANSWVWLVVLAVIIFALYYIYLSFKKQNALYQYLLKKFPKLIHNTEDIFAGDVNSSYFWKSVWVSIFIEVCGVLHLVIAMKALGLNESFSAAAICYVVSVLLMIVSPFLRGLGAVEFSLTFLLANFGYSHSQALGITLVYRVFEFWLPLVLGICSFLWNGRKMFARIFPALLIFSLGIINILSVITPAITERLLLAKNYFSVELVHYSKILTLIAGVLLLATSANLLRGSKRAWYFAIVLSLSSLVLNLLKALDYEEALFSFFTILFLIYARKEYTLKNEKHFINKGFGRFLAFFISVLIFNCISLYFIDVHHFGTNFNKEQAFSYTLQSFLLFHDYGIKPLTGFARDFQILNQILGVLSWTLLIISFYRTAKKHDSAEDNAKETAESLIKQYGDSSLDYFKTTKEKSLYFSKEIEGFVSYRVANGFAIVLEEPVCAVENKIDLIDEFDKYCQQKSLKTAYYRVTEDALHYFKVLKKKKLFIGQEALLNAEAFSLTGKDRKSLRNAINLSEKSGYKTEIKLAPQSDEFIDELQKLSNEWLQKFDKKEIVFAEGLFDKATIKNQDVISLFDENGTCVAFLNIIPDCAREETSYDMIRRSENAAGGSMDVLIVKLVEYAKSKGLKFINMGMTPMAGNDDPNNVAEELMKIAYEKMGSFRHYQTQRGFKEKYADVWENAYLIYSNDIDLIQLPMALNKVMKA
ncbi:phosphatidylglycerol lysyltransferase domain-containing protein [Soonwooa sp.]|uniref:phosphatidylglycerol lysyltransferase domain-containing protein n=1 Tax=Soonwooa sp. TaxID=1938592 RepID=UPI00262695B5|nr:phosphatidylglycerol lysyltransferase domain-containing protein [Soonwooa sp.]